MLERMREDIAVVFERDPAAKSTLEIVLAYPGLHALWLHRLNHWLWTHGLFLLARFGSHVTRFLTGIEIHPGARIGSRFFIDHGMGVVIGETTEIGSDCSIYHGVTLGGTTWNKGKRHPTLEAGVIIGAGAKVLGPIVLGAGSRIGSNAVVVKDVPPGSTVVGVPGHVIARKGEDDKEAQREAQREAIASKIKFEAYAERKDMPDPIQNAFDSMLDHMHDVETRLKSLQDQIARLESGDRPKAPD